MPGPCVLALLIPNRIRTRGTACAAASYVIQRREKGHDGNSRISMDLPAGGCDHGVIQNMPLSGPKLLEKLMAMNPQERTEFVDAYRHRLITTWSSEEFAGRVDSDIQGAMKECGLAVPANAIVERVRDIPEVQRDGGLDVQI